jgi:alpha/beta superfamily hydrolase
MSVKSWSEKAVNLAGPTGALDIRLGLQAALDDSSDKSVEPKFGFIMCHPHPLYSGTMDNKVVTTLVRGASRLELDNSVGSTLDTIRFNFRGVGQSEGEHDHGKGEQDDLGVVVDFAINELGWTKVILAGFSFGAGVACLYASQHPNKVNGLFLIAPAVHHFDAPSTLPFEFESYVYMGDADEVVPFDEVEHWVDLLTPQPHWHIFEEASHFFHGRLIDLKNTFLTDLKVLLASS